MESLKVAAVQLTSSSDWRDNFLKVQLAVKAAAKEGARLVVLPENVFLFNGKAMRALAESDDQTVLLGQIKQLAQECGVYLIVGSHPSLSRPNGDLVSNGRVRQSCLVVSPDGKFIERYDKIHLFDVTVDDKAAIYKESSVIEPGEVELKVIDVDGFKVGLSVCYDLRFPELYRALSKTGAELLLVPAAFTYVTGKAHWNTLLAARAIENQCYVLGVGQCGWHNETRHTFGYSSLYSPNGELLVGLQEEPAHFVYEIDKHSLLSCRKNMPCLSHRRM